MMIMIVWIVLLMKGYTEGAAGTKIDSASTSKPRLQFEANDDHDQDDGDLQNY